MRRSPASPALLPENGFDPGRRTLLKLGLAGGLALGTTSLVAGLSGCGKRGQAVAAGFRFLRDADVVLFNALAPVVLEGVLPADAATRDAVLKATVLQVDLSGLDLAPPMQVEVYKLLDLLHLRPTRWLTTGIAAPWDQAGADELNRFLLRWRDSSLSAFNAGYRVLNKLITVSYFAQPSAWPAAGYPGPLDWVYKAVNA